MGRVKRYASEAEKQAAYRERKKNLVLGIKEAVVETTVPGIEMTVNPKYEKAKFGDDELPCGPVVHRDVELFSQRCELCNRMWGASIKITCPYCHGKGIKNDT